MTRVRIPGGAVYQRHDPRPEHPTVVWVDGYGFLFDEPTPRPPERRERR